MGPESETGDSGRKSVWGRIANAKSLGWAIYAAGFAIWLFGYLSAGHAPVFDWNAATPWCISSFVPNLEAELGLALMFASMVPTLPWARLFPFAALLVFAGCAASEFAQGLHVLPGRFDPWDLAAFGFSVVGCYAIDRGWDAGVTSA